MHHVITLRLENRLHVAPIGDNPQRVLDLGTGTGIWAIEMGVFPSQISSLSQVLSETTKPCADSAYRRCVSISTSENFFFLFVSARSPQDYLATCKTLAKLNPCFCQILGNDLSPIQPSMYRIMIPFLRARHWQFGVGSHQMFALKSTILKTNGRITPHSTSYIVVPWQRL